MAGRLLALSARAVHARAIPVGACGVHDEVRTVIGNREIVGYGYNGQANYADRAEFPLPAIRWKEPTPDIAVLLLLLARLDYPTNIHYVGFKGEREG